MRKTRSNGAHNRKQGLNGRGPTLDSYDVREWFSRDPSACISNRAAQKILREYEHPSRWWITFPIQDEEDRIRSRFEKMVLVRQQREPFSRNEILFGLLHLVSGKWFALLSNENRVAEALR